MYLKVAKIFGLSCALLVLSVGAQEPPKKNWKDRQEYDMFVAIQKEAAPAKRLELLNAWKEKYPTSDYKEEGLTIAITTNAQLQKLPDVIKASKDLLQVDAKNATALFYLVSLTRSMNDTSAGFLSEHEKFANQLLGNLDTIFPADKKPAQMSDADWKKARNDMELLATKTLGWISMTRKDYPKAEEQLTKVLQMNPGDAEISYWMYTVIRAMNKPERRSEAFFHIARAASLTGPGAMPDAARKQVEDFLVKSYTAYHGPDEEGLKQLRKMAVADIKPPAGFYIKSAVEIATEKENEFKKSNPQLAFWMGVRKELDGPKGAEFFEERMKGAKLPGKIADTEHETLKGKVISIKPAVNPKEIVLGLQDATNGEVTLKLETPLRGKADPGTELEFSGTASAFTPDPFMVTFDVEKDDLKGWPAQAAPAPAAKKAAGGAKRGKKK